jgi:hypothetical protein
VSKEKHPSRDLPTHKDPILQLNLPLTLEGRTSEEKEKGRTRIRTPPTERRDDPIALLAIIRKKSKGTLGARGKRKGSSCSHAADG